MSHTTNAQLLPELFGLLQQVESGQSKAQDFDKNAGSLRLALNSIRSQVQTSEGISESVQERRERNGALDACNQRRALFLQEFRRKVLADLGDEEN